MKTSLSRKSLSAVKRAVAIYKPARICGPTECSVRGLDRLEASLTNLRKIAIGDIRIIAGEHTKHGYVAIVRDDRGGHWTAKAKQPRVIKLAGLSL